MQRTKKITAFVLAIALCVGMLPILGVNAKAADTGKHMDVLFTHDTHSHLNSFSTIVDGKQEEVGGFARLKTLIDEQKEKNPDTLYLDGGDFSMVYGADETGTFCEHGKRKRIVDKKISI